MYSKTVLSQAFGPNYVPTSGAFAWHYSDHADGYHVVQWRGEPNLLQEEAVVEGVAAVDGGADDGKVPAGTIVCEGI